MKAEFQNIIEILKNKYPNEDLGEIINYYRNIENEGTNLDNEQVSSLYNILFIIFKNPNNQMLQDFFAMEYERFCKKYGQDVIDSFVDKGRLR